jgi:hypothetical protein
MKFIDITLALITSKLELKTLKRTLMLNLPDDFTQLGIFVDRVNWENFKKPCQLVLSILKRQLHQETRAYAYMELCGKIFGLASRVC